MQLIITSDQTHTTISGDTEGLEALATLVQKVARFGGHRETTDGHVTLRIEHEMRAA